MGTVKRGLGGLGFGVTKEVVDWHHHLSSIFWGDAMVPIIE